MQKRVQKARSERKAAAKKPQQQGVSEQPKRKYKPMPIDMTFTLLLVIIMAIGLVMLFSASSIYARYYDGDSFHYIKRQFGFALVGFVVMFIISQIDYHIWERFTWPIYGLSIGLLILVLLIPSRDFKRWINLGFIMFQPSEIAKFAVILVCAKLIVKFGEKYMKTFKYGVMHFVIYLIPVVILLLLEPHLSGTVLIVSIAAVLMLVGGTRLRWFAIVGGAGAPLAFVLVNYLGYAKDRIDLWRDPFIDKVDKGYQTVQSLYAISSGGLLGQGFGNSRQKFLYVPEPQNDFIFSIVCEELGFVGATLIVLLFALLVWRGFTIAMRSPDKFGALLAMGIVAQVGIQTLLNIAVVTNTLPNTGISLPFFSYGGSSLLMLLGEMGIVLSVSRYSRIEKE